MTQFVPDDPDIPIKIPIKVKKALEEERLVFFCGAGISCYMGLPLFKGLVTNVCDKLGIHINKYGPLKSVFCEKKYDFVFGLLEEAGKKWSMVNPSRVREEVIKCLEGYDKNISPDTHKALLELSVCGDGSYRLVTTNFDRLFFEAGLNSDNTYCAPFPTQPSDTDWNKVTFLHGVIDCESDPKGKNLVLTNVDFGKTYFIDKLAKEFAINLFKEFTILMVGYSLNDPIMEYLISAVKGEGVDRVFALAGYDGGNRDAVVSGWVAKGVIPIPYDNAQDYKMLHQTLRGWANLKRGGTNAQMRKLQSMVNARRIPDSRTIREVTEFIISNERLAEMFSKSTPSPQINWLNALADYEKSSINSGKQSETENQNIIKISQLAGGSHTAFSDTPLSFPVYHISLWLAKNLDEKELVHWVIESGGIPHPEFRDTIRRALAGEWERKGLPSRVRIFWEIVSSEEYAHDHVGVKE